MIMSRLCCLESSLRSYHHKHHDGKIQRDVPSGHVRHEQDFMS